VFLTILFFLLSRHLDHEGDRDERAEGGAQVGEHHDKKKLPLQIPVPSGRFNGNAPIS